MRQVLYFFVFLTGLNLLAADYWTPEQLRQFELNKRKNLVTQFGLIPLQNNFPQVSYPAEFYQIADFLSRWQVTDPASPDYGGMIEAESGPLGNVIQTDNTQEAIVVWCKHAEISGDTSRYKPNIDAAWVYVMNFPAYNEEGAPGDDYYRNHNCAWAVWANMLYETVYGDLQFRWYADSCANYMAKHQIPVFTPNSNLNAFVMGWMAGNLYQYALYRNNPAWKDSALVIAGKVLEWANADPVNNLSDYTWAMSAGTAVWGLCQSLFQEDPALGVNWIQQNITYLPAYFDNTNGGAYVWDSAWNVALANAYSAMYSFTQLPAIDAKQKWLTDYLLSLDTDDDGGIVANKWHPDTEDMSWVSAYLNMMGVGNRFGTVFQKDCGVVSFLLPDSGALLLPGDSILCKFKIANFGWAPVTSAHLFLQLNNSMILDTLVDLQCGEMANLLKTVVVPEADSLKLTATLQTPGDENPENDSVVFSLPVEPLYWLNGSVTDRESGAGIITQLEFSGQKGRKFSGVSDSSGVFRVRLIKDQYRLNATCAFPYSLFTIDSLQLSTPPFPSLNLQTDRSDVLLIDDDEGAAYERYYLNALNEIFDEYPALPWRGVFLWDRQQMGIFTPEKIQQLKSPNIIWFTGDADTTALDADELAMLGALRNYQVNLLLTGKNIAELTPDSAMVTLFDCQFAGNSQFLPKFVYGVTGDPVSDQLKFYTWGGDGANNQLYERDILQPGNEAAPIFHYLPQDSQVAGVRLPIFPVPGESKTIFLGFGIEGIRDNYGNYQNRVDLLKRCLLWFDDNMPIDEASLQNRLGQDFEVFPCYPNPFNNDMQIQVQVYHPQNLKIAIYDVLGREIATLWDSPTPAGRLKLKWNGLNDRAGMIGSGVYFIQTRGMRSITTQKILLVK